jgi:hypothetical protein
MPISTPEILQRIAYELSRRLPMLEVERVFSIVHHDIAQGASTPDVAKTWCDSAASVVLPDLAPKPRPSVTIDPERFITAVRGVLAEDSNDRTKAMRLRWLIEDGAHHAEATASAAEDNDPFMAP